MWSEIGEVLIWFAIIFVVAVVGTVASNVFYTEKDEEVLELLDNNIDGSKYDYDGSEV